MINIRNCKPVDRRAALGGWCPPPVGHLEYACECKTCGCTFAGAKRAHQCADCAYGNVATDLLKSLFGFPPQSADEIPVVEQFERAANGGVIENVVSFDCADFYAEVIDAPGSSYRDKGRYLHISQGDWVTIKLTPAVEEILVRMISSKEIVS